MSGLPKHLWLKDTVCLALNRETTKDKSLSPVYRCRFRTQVTQLVSTDTDESPDLSASRISVPFCHHTSSGILTTPRLLLESRVFCFVFPLSINDLLGSMLVSCNDNQKKKFFLTYLVAYRNCQFSYDPIKLLKKQPLKEF